MTKAFVIGNGRSRLGVDLEKLKTYGKIYGCNALYRDFEPDCLIAVDPKMVFEICENRYQLTHEVWTNPNTKYQNFQNLNIFKNPKGWSSGPTALYKSVTDGHKEIFILGFDYYGVNNFFNNVYADTPNYKKSDDTATYYGNWMRQTEVTIKEFKDNYFYRVINSNTEIIKEWEDINNLKQIYYDEMNNLLKKNQ